MSICWWYDLYWKFVVRISQIGHEKGIQPVCHSIIVSIQTQGKNFNSLSMAYQIPINTLIFDGGVDPKKHWFVWIPLEI